MNTITANYYLQNVATKKADINKVNKEERAQSLVVYKQLRKLAKKQINKATQQNKDEFNKIVDELKEYFVSATQQTTYSIAVSSDLSVYKIKKALIAAGAENVKASKKAGYFVFKALSNNKHKVTHLLSCAKLAFTKQTKIDADILQKQLKKIKDEDRKDMLLYNVETYTHAKDTTLHVVYNANIIHETEKALLIKVNGDAYEADFKTWMPKSFIVKQTNSFAILSLPNDFKVQFMQLDKSVATISRRAERAFIRTQNGSISLRIKQVKNGYYTVSKKTKDSEKQYDFISKNFNAVKKHAMLFAQASNLLVYIETAEKLEKIAA